MYECMEWGANNHPIPNPNPPKKKDRIKERKNERKKEGKEEKREGDEPSELFEAPWQGEGTFPLQGEDWGMGKVSWGEGVQSLSHRNVGIHSHKHGSGICVCPTETPLLESDVWTL